MGEPKATPPRRKGLAAANAALAAGLVAGLGDGASVVAENPNSFAGATDAAGLVAASAALGLAAGAGAGGVAAVLRLPARWVLGGGIGAALFFWAGVRLHVRFFFGEPLGDPAHLAAMVALAVVGLGVSALVARAARGAASGLGAPRFTAAMAAVLAASAATAGLLGPRLDPPPPGADAPADGRDVLLVTLDTTRADHLSCYGYPHATTPAIDRLARRGLLVPRAHAAIPLTNPSHASMLTGLLPREHGVRNNGTALPDSVPTVVETLAGRGWTCGAFVSGIPLKRGLSGLARGFTVYDDAFSPLERVHPMLTTLALVRVANRVLPADLVERRADATCAAAARWIAETPGPRFAWVHLFDPHSPWDAPAVLRRGFEAAGLGWPAADYDAELRFADRALAELLRAWDRATGGRGAVVLTADHGEGLEQHGELTHGTQLYTEDVSVPLILAAGAAVSRADAGTAAPGNRAVGIAGEALPGSAPGAFLPREIPAALLAAASGRPFRPAAGGPHLLETFAPEGRENRSAVVALREDGGVGKLVVRWERDSRTAFDLTGDPGETAAADASGPAWDTLRAAVPPPPGAEAADLDPETERKLRALGYIH